MLAECGVDVGDAPDGAADAVGDGGPGPLACSSAGSLPPAEPEGLAQLLDEGVQLDFGPLGADPVVGAVRVVDLDVEVVHAGLVGAAGLVVEHGPGGAADVDAAHQLDGGQFTAGPLQEHGQVEHPLDVANR